MSEWLPIIILGIIEGITEFLPISSTGHLLIAERWLHRQSDLFNVVIQCGAVLAVLPLFPERCKQVVNAWKDSAGRDFLGKILLAFFITGSVGFVLENKNWKLPESLVPVAWALLVGGVLFVVIERLLRCRPLKNEITWAMAAVVGAGQLVSMIFPGASRSGATIIFLLVMGLNRVAATEFSFLVGVPTMMAAGGIKILKALKHTAGTPAESWAMVLLGFVVSAIVSFIAVKWLLHYVRTHTFEAFGWYRIVVGIALLLLLF